MVVDCFLCLNIQLILFAVNSCLKFVCELTLDFHKILSWFHSVNDFQTMKRKLKFHLTSYQHMRELSVMMLFSYGLIFTLCFADTYAKVNLNYSEVEKLGNSCPRLDSCAHQRSSGSRELVSIKERNCACDYLCSEYGDCCIDAPNIVDGINKHLHCYELKQFGGVYMKDTCLPSYDGPKSVKYLCERTEPGDLSDPLGSMPVTHSVTGLTYKNYYCSMCNENSDDIVLWAPRLECPTLTLFNSSMNLTDEFVFENLVSQSGSWGLYLDSENGSLFFHDCDVDPVMPLYLQDKIRLCKPNLVSDCSPDWTDKNIRTMCRTYMGAKFDHGGDGFRNVHCAICNHLNVSHLSCQSAEMRGINFFRQFETHAFSLLLDISERKGSEVGLVKVCDGGEVYDPFFKKCRSLTCLPGYIRQDGRCVLRNVPTAAAVTEFPVISIKSDILRSYGKHNVSYELEQEDYVTQSFPEDSELGSGILSGVSFNMSNLDKENPLQEEIGKFQNCLLISLTEEDYIMFPNQSLYVPKYDRLYEPTSYHASDGSVLVCTHFAIETGYKFVPFMGYVTLVGLGISMLCLVLHLIAFCFVPDLQNLSGKNLASQCVSLFCAYFCFILGQFDVLSFTSCTAMAFLTFYFFQVSFFWMAVMSFDVWRTLKMATTELRVSTGRQMRRFGIYTFFTWITPLFIVIILAFAEYTDLFPVPYRPGFARPLCWFKRRRPLLVFFAMPLMAIMLANVIFFLSSARMIVLTARTGVKHQSQTQRRNFKLYLRLALLMGLTWIVGIVAGYADIPALWYVFIILNTLQGLFIFVAFSCSTKVINYVQSRFRSSRRQELSCKSASTGSRSF